MKKYIVITNDDGFSNTSSISIKKEFEKGSGYMPVVIVPAHEMSAVSHSITLHKPMRLEKLGDNYYSLTGTPADCVRFARLFLLKDKKISFVISGINKGLNLGYDINYSGTCAGAREGLIWSGIPSASFSMLNHSVPGIKKAAGYVKKFTIKILKEFPRADFFLNVNFPDKFSAARYKITRIGDIKYKNVIEERKDPKGKKYYWQAGKFIPEKEAAGADITEYLENNISITPVKINSYEIKYKNRLEVILK